MNGGKKEKKILNMKQTPCSSYDPPPLEPATAQRMPTTGCPARYPTTPTPSSFALRGTLLMHTHYARKPKHNLIPVSFS